MILNKSTPLPPCHWLTCAALAAVLAGCAHPGGGRSPDTPEVRLASTDSFAAWRRQLDALLPADVLLLGEQHDADAHHALEADTVRALASSQQLAALVLEMADAGASTRALAPTATEAQAQAALRWDEAAWPWASYGPAVMAAVRAGVPVLGGNLPRAFLPETMKDPRFDGKLGPEEMRMQIDAIREGHCGLLPPAQLQPMARVQLARDESMAKTIEGALQPGRIVLLIAGNGHVRKRLGLAQWLPEALEVRAVMAQTAGAGASTEAEADAIVVTPALAPRDHCAELRRQWRQHKGGDGRQDKVDAR